MNPDPAEIIVNTTHMKYGQSYYSNNKQLNDRIALHFYYRLASSYIKSGKVLDFGCGVGHLIKRFKNNYRTYAYDISPYGLQLVKVNSPSTTIYSDLDLLRETTYDLAISLHVLEHLKNPFEQILFFYDVLNDGGILLYVVPNASALDIN